MYLFAHGFSHGRYTNGKCNYYTYTGKYSKKLKCVKS